VVVLAGLVLTVRGLRAAQAGRVATRRLAVEEALALDSRRRVVLLRCDGRHLLLLTGGGADVALGWVPTEDGR
jgi:flagellar protein FliO/FliZ